MTKFSFATDIHLRDTPPVNRKENNFSEIIFNKIKFILEQSKDCDFIILGGDVFHTPDSTNYIISELISLLKSINIPVYTVIGNHDVYGYSFDTFHKTALNILYKANVLHILTEPIIKDNIIIKPINCYDKEIDLEKNPEHEYTVVVAHKPISLCQIVNSIHINSVHKSSNADLILSGDIHKEHVMRKDNSIYLNPGAVVRLTIDEKERIPKFAKVHIDKKINFKLIDIPVDNDVFKNVDDKKNDMSLFVSEFVTDINNAVTGRLNIKMAIYQFLKNKNISKDVENKIMELLKEVEEQDDR